MTTRKHNEYLDLSLSDEDDGQDYDSEAAEEAKGGGTTGLTARRPKRQKLSAKDPNDDTESIISESESNKNKDKLHESSTRRASSPQNLEDFPKTTAPKSSKSSKPKSPPTTTTTIKHTPGVIYLSRIPPFMRPSTLSHLLSPFGPIIRLFLTPEPPSTYLRRKHAGGNKKRSFIDGWVEFSKKKHAKICAEAINGQVVGGKKGGWYRDDVWNVKYLRGFGWGDLMAGVRGEEREREERVRVGVRREMKERREFLEAVQRGKVEGTRRRKGEAREGKEGGKDGGKDGMDRDVIMRCDEGGDTEIAEAKGKRKGGVERRFRQNEISVKRKGGVEQSEDVKRVLNKIF